MTTTEPTLNNTADNYLAALDIGSNSFHFVLARSIDNHIQILHTEKYQARLADGLSKDKTLSLEAIERGVNILANLASATEHLTKDNFRAVATFTLREATNSQQFLKEAAKVFPFDIEIISGHEEARLIYQAVSNFTHSKNTRLVIDIGGGSTECIIGKDNEVSVLASLNMGCVSFTKQYFHDGFITDVTFKKAIKGAKREIDSIVKRFKKHPWQEIVGTSGTLKAIYKAINHNENIPQPVTLKQINELKKELIQCNTIKSIDIKGLKDNRIPVICAGVAIAIALMETLEIKEFSHCEYALREGVLFEQLDNSNETANTRNRTINSLMKRFNIDESYTDTAKEQALNIFDQVKAPWNINKNVYKELLRATMRLHEIGLDINPSGYHKHGAYILAHADLPGFNQEQQQALAWLVDGQRKKINDISNFQWYLLDPKKLEKLCIIVRLSILLTQQRHINESYTLLVEASEYTLTLFLDNEWLVEHPIVDTELFYEAEYLRGLGIELIIKS
ncbi:exopolyphosphatase [Pseudocolwellia sp. HL-MZ7]|uniref:Ppx/GppA phosphatase family protein n=1 Tax=Pseudocolwellia sp. HL-MZ7 TaxID=3400627 RepID=UPI003CEA3CF8